MKICYIDEAGDTGTLKAANDSTQPVLAIAGLIFDYKQLHSLTKDFIDVKRSLFPGLHDHRFPYEIMLKEIKGSELRRNVGRGTHAERRHAIRYIDEVFKLIKKHNGKLITRIWIKGIAKYFDGRAVYTSSMQALYSYFQAYLSTGEDYGIVIADSRNKGLNVPVSHSIFTQKFRPIRDIYDRIYELPTFAHSDNHAGLQIADLISSAVLFPISTYVYCTGHVNNVHVQPKFQMLKNRYAAQLKEMQFRYQDAAGRYLGGIVVADDIGKKSGALIFR